VDLGKLFSNFGPKMSFCFPSAFGQMIFLCWGDVVKTIYSLVGMDPNLHLCHWEGGIPTSIYFAHPKMDAISFYPSGPHFVWLLIIPYHHTTPRNSLPYDEGL